MPEGFRYAPDVIDPAEEARLVAAFADLPFKEFEFHGFHGKRRVVSFGHRYDFNSGALQDAEPMPEFLLPLRERAAVFAGLAPDELSHALITEYCDGVAIGWHRDRPHYNDVIGVSLLSPCTFRMRRKRGASWQRASMRLPPRSIYLMRGPCARRMAALDSCRRCAPLLRHFPFAALSYTVGWAERREAHVDCGAGFTAWARRVAPLPTLPRCAIVCAQHAKRVYLDCSTRREGDMANVYIEPRPKGRADGSPIDDFVVEDGADQVLKIFSTQKEAIDWAKQQGHHPLVARVRHLNNKKMPDQWRAG